MKRILLVEDNKIALSTMQYILSEEGYEMLCATSGKEALDIIEKESVNLLITDLMLPFSSGYEVIDRMRKGQLNAKVPVIIVSGYRDEESVLKGFEVGANDYLKKPISFPELLSRVRLLLGYEIA